MNDKARVAQGPFATPHPQDASDPRLPVEVTAIWLASSSAALKARLLAALPKHPQVVLLGHCDSDDESLATQLAERRPDLLLIDWHDTPRPKRGLSVMKDYAALAPRVLLLVGNATAGVIEGILKHRLHGYLRFDSTVDECVRAIACVRQGEIWIPRARLTAALAELVWQRDAQEQDAAETSMGDTTLHQFTAREQQIVILVRQGMTNKQIARELGIVEDTVKKHLQHVYDKIGVRRRALLVLGTKDDRQQG
jgi:DNA-binding NarL/FixJ family response regulator